MSGRWQGCPDSVSSRVPATPREGLIDPILATLGAGLVVATVTDIRTKRVPNALTFGFMLVALVMQGTLGQGWLFGLYGLGAAFALHFVLYLLKLEGAGDAKLMMGVGAMIGGDTMIESTLWRYVLNVPYAAVVLTVLQRWPNFMAALRWSMAKARGMEAGERPEPTLMPFVPLITLSVIAALSTSWLDFIK